MKNMNIDSNYVAKVSVELAISSRDQESEIIKRLNKDDISAVAVDIGGDFVKSIPRIVERALVASHRANLIKECHIHDGAVVGATREAIMQISSRANGFNVGGKIGIARYREHLSVCIFLSIGIVHLNDVVIGLAHRSIGELV